MGDARGQTDIQQTDKQTVMNSTFPLILTEWGNLQHPQKIVGPSLIMCTPTKKHLLPSTCQTLIIKTTRHVIISKRGNLDYNVCIQMMFQTTIKLLWDKPHLVIFRRSKQ